MQKWFINLLLVLLIPVFTPAGAQEGGGNLSLLIKHVENQHPPTGVGKGRHTAPFPFANTLNPLKIGLGGMMWFYQNMLSPQLSSSCIYHPTCSSFSIQLIREYGVVRGTLFTADRLTRCTRLTLLDIPEYRVSAGSRKIHEHTDYYLWPQKEKH